MSRLYVATFKSIAVTVQQDLFELLAPTTLPAAVHGFMLSQSTELGDAAEEQLLLTTNRGEGTVTTGSGGSTLTARPLSRADAASSLVVKANNTTKMVVGTGALVELEAHNWNVRIPYIFWYTPETRPLIRPSDRWTLELETTPVDSITISGTIWFEEIG